MAKMTDAELTEFIQTSRLHVDPGISAPTHCGHPRGCIVQGDGGTATCAWCEEVRLRMLLEQDGTAYLPCQHCGKDVATPTLESVELCFECWERLRQLIPDAGMLDWLLKAAHRWWKDNGGEGTQGDIEAGYALVEKLCREANVDGTRRQRPTPDPGRHR